MASILAPRFGFKRVGGAMLDMVLPPRCFACGGAVEASGNLCSRCWPLVNFLGPPWCEACGFPFAFYAVAGSLCAACARQRPAYRHSRAVFRYDEGSRGLILGFKHGDHTDAAPAFARWMVRAGATLLAGADILVRVPLHRWRLLARRYNQAALLAQALARVSGVDCVPDLLVRRRRTPSQGGLNPAERVRNVRGVFAVRGRRRFLVADRRVVLVDDVLTTGATAEACTRSLLGAGTASVDILTLARVVRPER